MGKMCCVKGCNSLSYANCGISFHKFPKDEHLKEIWTRITRQGPFWVPNPVGSFICSLHFEDEWIVHKGGKHCLLEGAIPTVERIPCLPAEYQCGKCLRQGTVEDVMYATEQLKRIQTILYPHNYVASLPPTTPEEFEQNEEVLQRMIQDLTKERDLFQSVIDTKDKKIKYWKENLARLNTKIRISEAEALLENLEHFK